MKSVKNRLFVSLIVGTLTLTQTAFAGISANYTLSSDYVWRGQTQTNHGPAVQGGMEYSHEVGFTAGAWLSNVAGGVENDLYAKYTHALNDDFSFGVGLTWYNYPLKVTATKNAFEYGVFAAWKMLKLSINYMDEYFGAKSNAMYYNLSGNFELPMDLTLGLGFGYTDHEHEKKVGHTSYTDYLISLGKTHEGTTVALNFTDTDRKSKDAVTGVEQKCKVNAAVCDRSYFVTVGRTF